MLAENKHLFLRHTCLLNLVNLANVLSRKDTVGFLGCVSDSERGFGADVDHLRGLYDSRFLRPFVTGVRTISAVIGLADMMSIQESTSELEYEG